MSDAPLIFEVSQGNRSVKGTESRAGQITYGIVSSDAFSNFLTLQFTDANSIPNQNKASTLAEEEPERSLTDGLEGAAEDGAPAQIDLVQIEERLPKVGPRIEEVASKGSNATVSDPHSTQEIETSQTVPTNYQHDMIALRSTPIQSKIEAVPISGNFDQQPFGSKTHAASQILALADPEQRTTNNQAVLAKLPPVRTGDDGTKKTMPKAFDAAPFSKPNAVASTETSVSRPPASTSQMASAQRPLAQVSGDAAFQSASLMDIAAATIDTLKKNTSETPKLTTLRDMKTRTETTTYALVHEMKTATPSAIQVANVTSPPLVAQQEIDLGSVDRLDIGGQFETSARPAQNSPNTPVQISLQHSNQDARHVANQLATQFSKQRDGTTVIRLNPDELGQVRMTMRNIDGVMSMTIVTERPETADIMRRNINDLAQEFLSLGFENLSFEFKDDGPQQDNASAQDTLHDTERVDPERSANIENTPFETANGRLNLRL